MLQTIKTFCIARTHLVGWLVFKTKEVILHHNKIRQIRPSNIAIHQIWLQ